MLFENVPISESDIPIEERFHWLREQYFVFSGRRKDGYGLSEEIEDHPFILQDLSSGEGPRGEVLYCRRHICVINGLSADDCFCPRLGRYGPDR